MTGLPDGFGERHQPGVKIEGFRPVIHGTTPPDAPAAVLLMSKRLGRSLLIHLNYTSAFDSNSGATKRGDVNLDLVFEIVCRMSLNIDFDIGMTLSSSKYLCMILVKD